MGLRADGRVALTLAALASAQGDASPQLKYLALRCVDRPIDLQPAFNPRQAIYHAELDFGEPSFAIDAQPAEGMDFMNADEVSSTRVVPPGQQVISSVKVQNHKTKEHLDYSITVHRLTGNETHLRRLRLLFGASLQPSFTPETQDYRVLMPAELDRLHLEAVLLDAGQVLQVTSHPSRKEHFWETTSPAPFWDQSWALRDEKKDFSGLKPRTEVVSTDALEKEGRRLQLSGELQRATMRRSFPVEVNGSRLVKICVVAASGSADRTYQLTAFRAPCPAARPFYAPDVEVCAMTCNDGYFPRTSSSRCERCPQHCVRCRSWQLCEVCETSHWQTLHFLRLTHGRCERIRIHWRQLLVGLCSAIGVISICFCFCFACCFGSTSRPKRRRRPVSKDSDQEEQSQRLLKVKGISSDED